MERGKPPEKRLLAVLEQLFELVPASIDVLLSQCADLIGEATGAEKVDAFLFDAASHTLVAVGTSHTELSRLQKSLGLDRLALANADPTSVVYQTGEPYHHGHIDTDPSQPRGVVDTLGVRSMVAVPIEIGSARRGVISLASKRPEGFSTDDLSLMKIVARWVGGLVHRSELVGTQVAQAGALARQTTAEELITVVAHDLRNMLTPIVTRVHILVHNARAAGRADDLNEGERILLSLRRLAELMTDLLDVPRIEQGLLSLTHERFDIVEQVRTIARTHALPEVDIRVQSYTPSLPILADRQRLAQALGNVLSNATKHSPRGAPVFVELAPVKLQNGDAVRIAILDQGPGIAPELLPRIFDRYVSGGPGSGLGLGLYLTRAVITAHGGTIVVASSPPQGTRCEITLPLVAAGA